MLHKLCVDNYKCLVNFELSLKEVTLLFGPTGAGKTSILDVMFRLRRVLVDGIKVVERDAFPGSTLTRWDSRDVQTFRIEVHLDADLFTYQLEIEHERSHGRARISSEQLDTPDGKLFSCSLGEVQLYRDDHSEGPRLSVDWGESFIGRVSAGRENKRLTRFMDFMRGLVVCALQPETFVAESARESTVLGRNGANFADWYRHLVQERTDLAVDFAGRLKQVLEDFRGIRMEKIGEDTRAMLVEWNGSENYNLRFDEISDGQRMLIVLYALSGLAGGQGFTLFLDEPDNYVALAEIQPWVMELVDACGNAECQAVLCSHHPEIINYLGPDKGVLLERTNAGVTTTRALATIDHGAGLPLADLIARGWADQA